jgi:hypothetical protein
MNPGFTLGFVLNPGVGFRPRRFGPIALPDEIYGSSVKKFASAWNVIYRAAVMVSVPNWL